LGHKALLLLLLLLLLMQLELLVLWQQAVRIGRYVRSHVRSLESLLRLEALLEVVSKARLTRRIDLLILLILLEHLLMLLHLKLRLLCQHLLGLLSLEGTQLVGGVLDLVIHNGR